MTAARPVNHPNNLCAFRLHIGNDFADEYPHDPLLQSLVSRRRVPDRRQILRQTQKNFFIRGWRRLALLVELLQFTFQFFRFLQRGIPASL